MSKQRTPDVILQDVVDLVVGLSNVFAVVPPGAKEPWARLKDDIWGFGYPDKEAATNGEYLAQLKRALHEVQG